MGHVTNMDKVTCLNNGLVSETGHSASWLYAG
jgi:hypothetical protein